jgi:hypothetical protein
MAERKRSGNGRKRAGRAKSAAGFDGAVGDGTGLSQPAPGTTGRFLVLMREGETKEGTRALEDVGLSVASSAEFSTRGVSAEDLATTKAMVFEELGVAVVESAPEEIRELGVSAAEDGPILAIEPERVVFALEVIDAPIGILPTPVPVPFIGPPPTLPAPATPVRTTGTFSAEYLRGYHDAVVHLARNMLGDGLEAPVTEEGVPSVAAETDLTWGLQVTRVASSRFSGRGIRVAVLDTGLDLGHPDFTGRAIQSRSFVPGQAVQDGHGHGTHCIGTACGPRQPSRLPRYGIAFGSEIFAGKVLSNGGSGSDAGILAGIEWALRNRCAVVSMSLGAPVAPGTGHSRIFEQVARRCLNAGTLIIAAAGNDSNRPSSIAPVSHPANCPSIMAVAALDSSIRVAAFSNGGLNPQGGQVDIAGPGVAVISSWPRPVLYRSISGTSMATPHVAGIAALFAESDRNLRGRALASVLMQTARRLFLPARDVGSGLVQAP